MVTITARIRTMLPLGARLEPGGDLSIDGFEGVVGTIRRAEVVEEGWLEVVAEIDEETRTAYLLRPGATKGLSL